MAGWHIKIITSLLIAIIAVHPLGIYGYNDISLHEDPEAAGVEIDVSLLLYYALLFKAILYPDDYNLTLLLQLYGDMYIPSDLAYILSRLNELIVELDQDVNETRFHIDHALDYISFKAFKEALEELYDARVSLAHANITYQDLLDAVDEFLRSYAKYKVVDTRFTEAREELRSLSQEIERLLEQLLNQIESLEEESEKGYQLYYEGKEETFLTLYLNSSEAWVGSYIEVYGALYTANMTLPNRVIWLNIMDMRIKTVTSDSGEYSFLIKIPYIYRERITLTAYYTPIESDEKLYAPAINQTSLRLLYIETKVSIEVDEEAYPGLRLNMTIHLTPPVGNASRRVSIYIDDGFMGRFPVREKLSTSFTLPPNMSIGRHIVRVDVEPYREYSPAKTYKVFTVTYMKIDFEMDVSPKVVIYPLNKPKVFGRVFIPPNKPFVDRLVHVYVGDEVYETFTSGTGYFSISIDPPFTLISFTVKASINPGEPWYPTASKVIQVYTVNLYLLLCISLLLLASIYVSSRLIGGRPREEAGEPPRRERRVRLVEDIVIPTLISRRPKPSVERDPVTDMYYSAVDMVSGRIGSPRIDETLREYYRRASEVLGDAREAFWRLTLLAERSLYSDYKPTKDDAELAKKYYEEVRMLLHEE